MNRSRNAATERTDLSVRSSFQERARLRLNQRRGRWRGCVSRRHRFSGPVATPTTERASPPEPISGNVPTATGHIHLVQHLGDHRLRSAVKQCRDSDIAVGCLRAQAGPTTKGAVGLSHVARQTSSGLTALRRRAIQGEIGHWLTTSMSFRSAFSRGRVRSTALLSSFTTPRARAHEQTPEHAHGGRG